LHLALAGEGPFDFAQGRSAPHKPRGYNNPVSAASPPPDQPSPEPRSKSHIYKLEAAGILIIGMVVLMLILTRYWHHIAWGAR